MSERAPGFEDYTPSRLEWLVVLLNSYIQYMNNPQGEGIEYAYVPATDGKTIVLNVKHPANLDPETVKVLEENGKNFAMDMAKNYKWDSWINIRTQLRPTDEQAPKSEEEK